MKPQRLVRPLAGAAIILVVAWLLSSQQRQREARQLASIDGHLRTVMGQAVARQAPTAGGTVDQSIPLRVIATHLPVRGPFDRAIDDAAARIHAAGGGFTLDIGSLEDGPAWPGDPGTATHVATFSVTSTPAGAAADPLAPAEASGSTDEPGAVGVAGAAVTAGATDAARRPVLSLRLAPSGDELAVSGFLVH